MPYIGNELATQFQAFVTQTITGDGSTGYTLDRAVANGKELLVYINNVKQEEGSGKSYTATGTTITFSDAVASTDSCYVVFLGSAVGTIVPPDASVGSTQLASGAVTSAKLDTNIAVSGDLTVDTSTLKVDASNNRVGIATASPQSDLHVTGTAKVATGNSQGILGLGEGSGTTVNVGLWRGAANAPTSDGNFLNLGGYDGIVFATGNAAIGSQTEHMRIDVNGHVTKPLQPAFMAEPSSTQSDLAINTSNLQINFGNEAFDQNGDYNTSNSTFTAPVTGKYQLNLNVYFVDINENYSYLYLQIRTSNRNYRSQIQPQVFDSAGGFSMQISHVCDMDASDTATITCQLPNTGSAQTDVNTYSQFSGYLVA